MKTKRNAFVVVLRLLVLMAFLSATAVARRGGTGRSAAGAKLVIGVDGGTESIRACCFDVRGNAIGTPCAVPYKTYHPQPGWAEQDPHEWWSCLGEAVRGVLTSLPNHYTASNVAGICVDTTCCSVVALDGANIPLRSCLLWMDQRAGKQALDIFSRCQGDPNLSINSGGEGPLSAEWMIPKSLWIAENEPEIWSKAATICEYQDYINYRLTGIMTASSCNAATRWHWNGNECLQKPSPSNPYPGRPLSLYEKLGIPDLAEKLPLMCLPPGALIGITNDEATEHLGLSQPIPVVQGGADAFIGMIGLGCIRPGQLCLITGSSHLHCVVSAEPGTAVGTWGAYTGAPLPDLRFAEGGQSSTGSLLRWARSNLLTSANSDSNVTYAELDLEASAIKPGSDGLVALETFQGSRTPVTDPLARGALVGLTLAHKRAHVWRALLEAVCFGTKACIGALQAAGHSCNEIIIAGGATRSPLWLQLHADVTGKPVVVCEYSDAPLLGCAILAAVGVGLYKSVPEGVDAMVRVARRIEPNAEKNFEYEDLYERIYRPLADAVRPIAHSIGQVQAAESVKTAVSLSGGMTRTNWRQRRNLDDLILVGENDSDAGTEAEDSELDCEVAESRYREVVSPSLLACDWSRIRHEVKRCLKAKANRLHIDVFDGVFLDSPKALTFGPQMVAAIRRSCDRYVHDKVGKPKAVLDLHMCVERPHRYVAPMSEAGGDRFVFQYEAVESLEAAIELAVDVRAAGMSCGVSVNPGTSIEDVYPLLATNLVDLVDILAVEPGFGGQVFQRRVLEKVRRLKAWREENRVDFDIMVDGGINDETSGEALDAGANVLVSGSYLFNHNAGMLNAMKSMLNRGAL
jgi:ribulose-phosphate 3-epimerase